jgi:hypothetical protein
METTSQELLSDDEDVKDDALAETKPDEAEVESVGVKRKGLGRMERFAGLSGCLHSC